MRDKRFSRAANALGSVLLLIIFAGTAFAQGDRGTITGVVVDSSGSAVAGAAVGIVNPVNNLSLKTVSNETGNYRLIGVPCRAHTNSRAQLPVFRDTDARTCRSRRIRRLTSTFRCRSAP